MAAEIASPGVEVVQTFRTVSPTVIVPTLPACIIGACKEVVSAVARSATGTTSPNSKAVTQLYASFDAPTASGATPKYTLPRSVFVFNVNNRPKVSVSFAAGDYTPLAVVTKIRAALLAAGETYAAADVIGKSPRTGSAFRVRTVSRGNAQQLEIDPEGSAPAVILGNVDLSGLVGAYGGGGSLDGKTILLAINGTTYTVTFSTPADENAVVSQIEAVVTSAGVPSLTSSNYLSLATTDSGESESIEITGGTALTILGLAASSATGDGSTADLLTAFGLGSNDIFFGADSYAGYQLNVPWASYPDTRNRGSLDELALDITTAAAYIGISANTALLQAARTSALLRKGADVAAVDDSNGDQRTPFVSMVGEDFTSAVTTPTAAVIVASAAPTFASLEGKTLILGDTRHPRTITFPACSAIGDVVDAINAEFNTADGILASSSGGKLSLECTKLREDGLTTAEGEDSQVIVYGGTAMTPTNYIDPGGTPTLSIGRYTGDPQKVAPGDDLWVDGAFVGTILQVAPNGVNTRLRLDREVSTSFSGSDFYIVANGLQALPAGAVDRPAPNLIVRSTGELIIKHGILRNTDGSVSESVSSSAIIPAKGLVYVGYEALRLDVSAAASEPSMLQFDTTTDVESILDPVNSSNPLALGLYLALLNAPDVSVFGLGLDEVSADYPEGTVDAFTRAAELLESQEVYTLVPLTHSEDVAQIFRTHVLAMSEPEMRGERIVLWNPAKPTHARDTVIASGTGDTVGSTGLSFDTGVANLTTLLLAAGLDPTSPFAVDDGLYLDIGSDSKNYSIASVAGSVVTITKTFSGSENDDAFYATTDLNDSPLPSALIDEPFAIKIRGAELVKSNGLPDKDGIAAAYAAMGSAFKSQRVWQIVPETMNAVVDGVENVLPGYFSCAVIAGAISQQPPQQSFTNYPMTGISAIKGTKGYYTEKQMRIMRGGGNYILMQDKSGGPVYANMALTTDTTSVELRTDSITKVVDFTAKFLRTMLRNFIGRFNITTALLDTLGTVLEGGIGYLRENKILIDAKVNNLLQDTSNPDSVLVDVLLTVPYPCNKIRLTLVI